MSESNSKKKTKIAAWKIILIILVFIVASFGLGMLIGKLLKPVKESIPAEKDFLALFVACGCMLVFSFLQTVIHEGGHLVFGLLSGYQYSSFRVGSFIWVKQDGKMKLKRFSLAGTGGQCLMAPPKMVDGKMPYLLYNMGGYIANAIVSVIPLVFLILFWEPTYIHFIGALWVFVGLIDMLLNAIPMKIQGIQNDGYNIMSMRKNPEALHAFWLQMEINAQNALGKRMRELPKEWFVLPSEKEMKDSLVSTIAVFCCNRLMDEKKYAEAGELMERLLTQESGMLGIHRHLLTMDLLYCELVGENRREKIEELYTDELKAFLKSMNKVPHSHRTMYLYEKYVAKNEKKAAVAMAAFEKVAKTYPYPHEIAGERDMLAYAEEKLEQK